MNIASKTILESAHFLNPSFQCHHYHKYCRSVLLCMCIRNNTGFFNLLLLMWIKMFLALPFFISISTVCASNVTIKSEHSRHCSPPAGSVDGHIVVEDGGGGISDLTTYLAGDARVSPLLQVSWGQSRLPLNTSVLAGLSPRPAAWQALWRLRTYL